MALDEPKENDETFDIDGFTYLMDKQLLEQAQPVKIDFSGFGFRIDCQMDFSAAGSACSACSTAGNCG